MKKILKSVLGLSMILFVWFSFCLWIQWWGDENPFPFWDIYKNNPRSEIPEDVTIRDENSIITRLLDVFNLDIVKSDEHKFLNYVKAILNVALGLLSIIALVMTIYTFYLMFFTENEAWAKKAKWNLVGIFIALAIIWLSWLIVSFIFRWYQNNRKDRQEEIEQGNISMVNYELNNQIYLNV